MVKHHVTSSAKQSAIPPFSASSAIGLQDMWQIYSFNCQTGEFYKQISSMVRTLEILKKIIKLC